jgi:undecaprenyl phosphate-alpha-L-ara4N flippase subunit ArnE
VKAHVVFLAILCQLFLVVGQLFFKRSMRDATPPQSRGKTARLLFVGIFSMSLWFFIWINLLEGENLSRIFPFEGLNPVLLVITACLLLKERLSLHTAAGVLLICGGILVASWS